MIITRPAFRLLAIAAALVTSTAIGASGAQTSPDKKPPQALAIDIDNFTFGVVTRDVAVGATVTWTNRDDIPHTVVSSTKVFKSPPLDTGDAFSYTFKEAGTFEYYCSLHPRMTGKIVVK